MRYLAPLIGLLLFSAAAVSEPASAQPNRAREGVRSGEFLPLPEILNSVRREQGPGQVADVQGPSIGPDGEPHYRLKWLTPDGRVQWIERNARTGLPVQGPGPGPQRRPPPSVFDQRRDFGPPPDAYGPPPPRPEFGRPGGPPTRFRPPPQEGFRGGPSGPDPRLGGGRPPPRRQEFSPGPPPEFAGPPPRPRPPPGFDRPPPRNRGELGREPPPRPRGNFNDGGRDSFRRPPPPPPPRAPEGEPRGPRRFR